MGMFNSPFEKLTAENQGAMSTSMTSVATSVSKGGDMFEIFSQMLTTLKQIEKNTRVAGKGGKGKAKGALMGLVGVGGKKIAAIGKGLSVLADALAKFEDPEKLEAKMLAITSGMMMLEGVGKSIFNFAKWLILATPLLIVAAVVAPLLGLTLTLILGTLLLVGRLMPKKKLLKTFIMLRMVGIGILTFVASIALAGVIAIYALKALPMVSLVLLGIALVFFIINKLRLGKSIRKTGRALFMAGKAIIMLAASLVLFQVILSLLGSPMETVMLVGIVVLGIAAVFFLLDKLRITKSIRKSARALILAGMSIVVLATSIVLAQFILNLGGDPLKSIMVVGLMIAGISIAFWLVGKVAVDIFKGALALIVAGVSLIVLGFGLKIMTAALPDPLTALGLLAMIGGLAVVFALVGAYEAGMMTGVPLTITLGSIAMMIVGVSLIVLGLGLSIIAPITKDMGAEDAGVMALVIGGIAVVFGVAGAASPFILLGAAALALAGVALIAIGKGLQSMNKALKGTNGILADSGHKTESTFGFGGGRMMSKMEYAIQSVGYSFVMAPWTAAGIAIGAASLNSAGKALLSIGKGIAEFQKIADKADLAKLGENVNTIVDTLSMTFAKVGKQMQGGRTGLMGAIFGRGGTNAVADGISAVMGMGEALTNIATGFQNMANLKFPTKYDKNGKAVEFETMSSDAPAKVAANTSMIVDSLASVFGKIGSDPKLGKGGKKGLFAQILSGSGQSPVADGISSVMGMGEALTNVATGFQSMADLKFPTKWNEEGKPTEFVEIDIPSAVKDVLFNTRLILLGENDAGGLVGMFKTLGQKNGPDKGWFTSTDYEKGKEMIQGVGTPIKELALGVQQMANMRFANSWDPETGEANGWMDAKDMPAKLKAVEANVKLILLGADGNSGLVGIFKKLGGEDDGGWFSSSTIEKGAEIAKMISKPIKDIADAATSLMSDKWSPEGASERIGAIITALAQGNEKLNPGGGLFSKATNPLEATAKYMKTIAEHTDKFKIFTDSFTKYVEDFVKYKDAVNDFDETNLKLTTDMFTGLSYLAKTEDAIENMSAQLTSAIEQLSEMISNLGGSIADSVPAAGGAGGAPPTVQKDKDGNPIKPAIDITPIVKAIQVLESRLDEPLTVRGNGGGLFD
mgnify:FL=1